MGEDKRKEEWKQFLKHTVSLTLSLTLVQIWVGFILTRTQRALQGVGVTSPTEDFRALLLFTAVIVGVYFVAEDLEIVRVPAGFGMVKYV